MKRAMAVLMMSAAIFLSMTMDRAWSEEAAWYDAAENWIVRVYSASAGADYAVTLEVLDTGNNLVTEPIVGLATNPYPITTTAEGPDVSLAFDEATATAYVLYTAGGVTLQTVPDITRVGGVITAAPNPVLYGSVKVGSTLKKTITITNTGATPLNITSIGSTGSPFTIVSSLNPCAVGTPVAAGGSCTIAIKFVPTVVDGYNGSFVVMSDGGNLNIKLIGVGIP